MKKFTKVLREPRKIVYKLYHTLFNLIGFFPIKKNLIIFESFLGKQYSDNPRAIYEYLREYYPNYQLLWSIDKKQKRRYLEDNIPFINRFSIKWLFVMPRANYWVINSRMPYWIKKPRHTIYLQTWHGTPLKKLAGDMDEIYMPGTTTKRYKEAFYKEAQNWDYLISPNAYSTAIFERAFKYDRSKILETGYPRNDFLKQQNTKSADDKIKDELGIPKHKKVILYAPTWRDNEYYGIGKYKFSLKIDFEQLRDALGEECVILLRLHYLIANRVDISAYKNFVYDLSSYDDIRELYIISDLLITDYSSVFFDFLCLKRPIIFYTYDFETYRDHLRGFYFDLEKEAPGPLVKTMEQLVVAIQQAIKEGRQPSEAIIKFHQKFCHLEDGFSTKRVVKSVFLERASE
ncbi:CDP-glycerol glycerophosphotransferase family protein [Bacillus sp. USDA818B3_A]|uniref:CDP-glycerol glycerophosphotransferase family protein n=1 Tax=Bacillus sp. USDA818B3_A TaxID=2698834 RepID=UPI00136D8E8B|nr:CDP-glycerol glycerophosphotransferase family protein [Bacillus sp. USDA818B3_A]